MTHKRVIIIIPTFNEAGNVDRLIELLHHAYFPQLRATYDMQVLVVDDTSPDGTAELVEKLKKKYEFVHLLINTQKLGLGNAYRKGMKYALDELKADIIFQFDADLSHDPSKIKPMLKKIEEGNDLVLGSRYLKGGGIPTNWGIHRKFLSVLGNLVIRIVITRFDIHDWTTGYRAIRADVVRAILPMLDASTFMGYTFQVGFLHKAVRKGYRISEVPFKFKDRTHGKSKLGTEYIKNTLYYILRVRAGEMYRARLFRFVMVGIFGAMVQLTSLHLFRKFFPYQIAYFFSVEMAVISNFIWSNLWTFADRALQMAEIPFKFVLFNLSSAGSILIQQVLAYFGETYIGLIPLELPLIPIPLDTGFVFAVVGILLGMFWNFAAYNWFIWRKRS